MLRGMINTAAAPRSFRARWLLAAAVDAVAIGMWATLGDGLMAYLIISAALTGVLAWLAPKVSLRRTWALAGLTGVGGLIVLFVVAWRLAYLPYRDWPPSDAEVPAAAYLQDPVHSGIWQLEDAPAAH